MRTDLYAELGVDRGDVVYFRLVHDLVEPRE